MSRNQKEKPATYADASLQITLENSSEESPVTAADDYMVIASEERRKEAEKPIYLKRV
jgi:hypothetical protein